jgi:hypothetical protein
MMKLEMQFRCSILKKNQDQWVHTFPINQFMINTLNNLTSVYERYLALMEKGHLKFQAFIAAVVLPFPSVISSEIDVSGFVCLSEELK